LEAEQSIVSGHRRSNVDVWEIIFEKDHVAPTAEAGDSSLSSQAIGR